jgi:hypothetical protein
MVVITMKIMQTRMIRMMLMLIMLKTRRRRFMMRMIIITETKVLIGI